VRPRRVFCAMKAGQFDDMDGAAMRVLIDEEGCD
jgi:cbb3-type cytochrome oxidase maturation protein